MPRAIKVFAVALPKGLVSTCTTVEGSSLGQLSLLLTFNEEDLLPAMTCPSISVVDALVCISF